MSWACSTYYEEEICQRGLAAKREGKNPFGRPRRRWEGNIKYSLKKWEGEGMNWNGLAKNGDR